MVEIQSMHFTCNPLLADIYCKAYFIPFSASLLLLLLLLLFFRYIDKNYGGTLIVFDRMFGTFQAEEEEVQFGITHTLGTWVSCVEIRAHDTINNNKRNKQYKGKKCGL